MGNFRLVQINIILIILLIIILGHAYFNMNRKKNINRVFMSIIGSISFVLIMEMVDILLNSSNLKQFIEVHKLVNALGFFVSPCILFLAYIFTKEWANQYRIKRIKVNKILILPLVINTITTLMSLAGKGVFDITSENRYIRGPLFWMVPSVCLFYVIYILYNIYKQRSDFSYSERILFSLFFVIPAVATGIQLIYLEYTVTWSTAAIVIIITYIIILNSQSYHDSLTGLGNRLYYERYTQNLSIKRRNNLFVIFIDIDEFKSINDKFGHAEGDEAIKAFSNLLRDNFTLRHNKLMRLGGDEFIILMEAQYKEKVDTNMQKLIQSMENLNRSKTLPYQLSFSYGLARYSKEYKTVCQVLGYADELMYEEKAKKKSMRIILQTKEPMIG